MKNTKKKLTLVSAYSKGVWINEFVYLENNRISLDGLRNLFLKKYGKTFGTGQTFSVG